MSLSCQVRAEYRYTIERSSNRNPIRHCYNWGCLAGTRVFSSVFFEIFTLLFTKEKFARLSKFEKHVSVMVSGKKPFVMSWFFKNAPFSEIKWLFACSHSSPPQSSVCIFNRPFTVHSPLFNPTILSGWKTFSFEWMSQV